MPKKTKTVKAENQHESILAVMTLEHLQQAIDHVEYIRECEDKLNDAFSMLNENHNYGMLGKLESAYVDMLQNAFDDTIDWIPYFIYDCDLGKDPSEIVFKDGNKMKLKTVKQLYQLLIEKI